MSQPSVLQNWAPTWTTPAEKPLPPHRDGLLHSPTPLDTPEESDEPNTTDIINHEYRHRTDATQASQWYFDEFSGLYRHNLPPPPSHTRLGHTPSRSLSASISRLSSEGQAETRRELASLDRSHSASLIPRPTSSSFSSSAASSTWPVPESIEQVYAFRAKARASGDARVQLDLCRELMQAAGRLHSATSDRTTPWRRDSAPDARRRRKKQELALSEVMVLEARRILKRLATVGQGLGKSADSEAQFMLANCFGIGALGFPIDHERAFQWYVQASKQAHPEATYRTAVCYELGIGTRKDMQRSLLFYRKAAHLSHGPSMYKLGIILLRGYCNQAIHAREAVSWLQRAAASTTTAAHPHALYALAMVQLTGECIDTSLIADPTYALELLHEAAHLDHAASQAKLGEIYEKGELVEADDSLSIYWYSRAAQHSHAEAELALSGWYLTGSAGVLSQSDREAYLWARKAAVSSTAERWTLSKALYLVAFYIEHGIGMSSANLEQAKRLYLKAAVLGHRGASARYHELAGSSSLSLDVPTPTNDISKEEPTQKSHTLLAKQFHKCTIM